MATASRLPLLVPPTPIFGKDPYCATDERGRHLRCSAFEGLQRSISEREQHDAVIETVMRQIQDYDDLNYSPEEIEALHRYLLDASEGRKMRDLMWTLFIVTRADGETYYGFGDRYGRFYPWWVVKDEEHLIQNDGKLANEEEMPTFFPDSDDQTNQVEDARELVLRTALSYARKLTHK